MKHKATRSYRNALTVTKQLAFSSSSLTGNIWLSNQISSYSESALLNPATMMAGAIRLVISQLCRITVLLELLAYTLLYLAVIAVDLMLEGRHLEIPKEIEDVSNKLTTLSAFLLAFYIGLGMTRWWRLRTDGVGGIWGANNDIAPLLSVIYHAVHDHSPQSARKMLGSVQRIRRYSAASLYYFFEKGGQSGFDEDGLLRLGLLTQNELEIMRALPGTQSEYLWSCVGNECGAITKLMSTTKLSPQLTAVYADKLTDMWMHGMYLIWAQPF